MVQTQSLLVHVTLDAFTTWMYRIHYFIYNVQHSEIRQRNSQTKKKQLTKLHQPLYNVETYTRYPI